MNKNFKIDAEVVEGKALDQFYSAMKNEWVVKGALMPDVHAGYSLPIGSVVATKDVIVPSWVGYDIGCGMCAIQTEYSAKEIKKESENIFNDIYKSIPVGFARNEKDVNIDFSNLPKTDFLKEQLQKSGYKQLGTLGGGNHFIEISEDEEGRAWIVIHSGSRNLGHKTATHYMKLASKSDKAREGHYELSVDSNEGIDYVVDMGFCLEFALTNRKIMIERVLDVLTKNIGLGQYIHRGELINRNHNHATFKDGMWIHRKGATHAEDGMMGVIPANMRDGSFIVKGKGNPDSLWSSSHGAGRVMSRKQAKELVNLEDFKAEMEGVVARVEKSTLDESPFAYKDIFEVMEQQKDLVEVIHHLKPIINIKG